MTVEIPIPGSAGAPTDDTDTVLVVDLDGTLCKTDTLHEALLALAVTRPGTLAALTTRLGAGRAAFKAGVLDHGPLDVASLPMNEDVVARLQEARRAGRRTALVSASDQRQVSAVAEATDLFDEAHGSTPETNLKGAAKAAFLVERYGDRGFDYIGDARSDLPVWAAARQAITVGAAPGLRRQAEAANSNTTHISPPTGRARACLRALRPHQWTKNVLVFLPMLAAHDLAQAGVVLTTFLAFCLTASAVYVINDLLDLSADRAHPRKRNRPFAAGDLTALEGAGLALALLGGALALALATGSRGVIAILGVYFGSTLAYSAWLKRRLIIDILLLAGLYTIRIVAGGVAAAVTLSPWLLGFSMFIFLALAAVKRQAELADQLKTARTSVGRAYQVEDLPIIRAIAIGAGQAAVLVLALYLTSDDVRALYQTPTVLWGLVPLLLYWILRMIMKTHRGLMNDDPIVYAATDRLSLLILVACACIIIAAT